MCLFRQLSIPTALLCVPIHRPDRQQQNRSRGLCSWPPAPQIAAEFVLETPIKRLKVAAQPLGGGLLSLDPVAEELRRLLPPRFEDLQRCGAAEACVQAACRRHACAGCLLPC